jgi:predicted O-linked N-acetylglucosamine transferase (SPINDLY family)
MVSDRIPNYMNWRQQAHLLLLQQDYVHAAGIYAEAIAAEPDVISHYWYLGLVQLLQGDEAEAQTTWMEAISEYDPSSEQMELWTAELVEILQTEADRQRSLNNFETAWLVCQHIREIAPDHCNNLLQIVWLSAQLQTLTESDLAALQIIAGLQEIAGSEQQKTVDLDLLWQVLDTLLKYPWHLSTKFAETCLPYITDPSNFVYKLIYAAVDLTYFNRRPDLAISLLELSLRVLPEEIEALEHLSSLYQDTGKHDQGIATAKLSCELSVRLVDKFFANGLLLRAFLNKGGHWQEVLSTFATQEFILSELIAAKPTGLHPAIVNRLYVSNYFAPYIRDDPKQNHTLQNQITQLCQTNINVDLAAQVQQFRQRPYVPNRRLKIGYISHCMATHSVGWLARWLLQHHDRDRFELYGYFQVYRQIEDDLQAWYECQMDGVYRAGVDGTGECDDMAARISHDEIDILVDLDSITLDGTCGVMARKPAPVQVTWLGMDASGIPAIDYFIADPYVLPESAQAYYSEKIWRLPHTYIAVDGFEIAVPSLRRDQLDIPSDATIFLSAQRGYKRHADTIHLQMQIIKQVPNSYFLIKGIADQNSIQDFFTEIANQEGVDPSRLRFLPMTQSEAIHRANLAIADVVLDTYPYNGATTTLETLWMCLPLVTRVGEQFAARNSYTMMINAGITEGIAWSDREYVEWGVRLGKDAALRQNIASRLKASRQTSPLWNAKQFTREMETAYEQMWEKFNTGN